MAGRLALRAEVFLRLDQPRAEDLRPEAVHGHSRRQRVPAVGQPPRQPQPVRGSSGREGHAATRARPVQPPPPDRGNSPSAAPASPAAWPASAQPSPAPTVVTGRAFSSAAILSRSGLSSGAIDPKYRASARACGLVRLLSGYVHDSEHVLGNALPRGCVCSTAESLPTWPVRRRDPPGRSPAPCAGRQSEHR